MREYSHSFLKSVISCYKLNSFFSYLILKVEELQPVTKDTETTTF